MQGRGKPQGPAPNKKEDAMIALAESMILIAVMVLTVCVIHVIRRLWTWKE
jgi:hypothetical protein